MKEPELRNLSRLAILTEFSGSGDKNILSFLSERGSAFTKEGGEEKLKELVSILYLPFYASHNNERIRRQSGAFIMAGLNSSGRSKGVNPYAKEGFDIKDHLGEKEEGIKFSIIVPRKDKEQLLEELDVLGINQAFLFPELEYQTLYIKEKYRNVRESKPRETDDEANKMIELNHTEGILATEKGGSPSLENVWG